ncbi:MAG: polyprenyl synthetase family protein [Myxococcota bacterium]
MEPAIQFADFLGDVERVLSGVLADARSGRPDTLMGAARHLCMGGGGKRARPILVRIFGEACGVGPERLVDVAVAAELIHSASLLHDDVVDAGMFRRGRPTVNARWGNIVAVMTGDMLLAAALMRLAQLDRRVTDGAVATVAEMTRAAMAEVEARGQLELPLSRLREIAEGKTGALFGWCGRAAAYVAGDGEAARCFDAFGRRLGVAFQIADDVRDLVSAEEGKPRYADVASRTLSVPILIAAAKDSALRRRLHDAWSFSAMTPERVSELGTAILCTGAAEEAVARMEVEIEAAVDALGPYVSSPSGSELVGWAWQLARGLTMRASA